MMASADGKCEVLAHHRDLKANITEVLNDLKDSEVPGLEAKLLAIQRAARGFENYLSTTIKSIYYAEHRSVDSKVAQKVFSIPELLELILDSLTIQDIMRCYPVCRTMRDTIEASSKLQVKLCLMPAPADSAFFWPFELPNYDYFSCSSPALFPEDVEDGETNAIIKIHPGSSTSLPSIGARWRRMLVRQPPSYSTTAHVDCSREDKRRRFPGTRDKFHRMSLQIESESGLTIGDLFEAARTLLERHAACPFRNDDGEGQKWVHFEGPLGHLG